uniref:Uncharacterized protein n=1 Tax=viral metagenome TaxID=1070528 RepID=A0A6C0B1Z2_9ZZZZ
MAKGGFLSALLAERNSSSTTGFAWRSLYYIYIGIPLLALYYVVFHVILSILVVPVMTLLGFGVSSDYQQRVQSALERSDFQELARMVMAESWVLGFAKLGLVVVMYHFGALDLLLQPVYYITKV